MAIFPKIQSPCPYKNQLAAVMDGDMCRMCKRQVVDITAMSDGERVALISGCVDEICVSYRLPAGAMLAAAAMTAALGAAAPAAAADSMTVEEVIVGGIRNPAKVEYVRYIDHAQGSAGHAARELPVVYEDTRPTPGAPTAPAKHDQPKPDQTKLGTKPGA